VRSCSRLRDRSRDCADGGRGRAPRSSQRRWFYVNLDLLLTEPDSDGIVFDRAKKELDGLDQQEIQFARRTLPCTKLLSPGDFMTWRDGFDDWLRENDRESVQRYRTEWRDPWTKAVTEFQNFTVPLVELPSVRDSDPESIGRVCAIFEKLNSSGVDLSVYDLLTARLYRSGIRLHNLWHEACQEHERLASWSEGKAETNKFGVLGLRTLALLRGLDPKPSILIDLKPAGFQEDWKRAAAAIERALELIEHVGPDGFGVFELQKLHDHHIFPKAFLKRHGLTKRSDVNSVVNRTLISDKTNGKVKDRAPAEYLANREIFPSGATSDLLRPHFVADEALEALQAATEVDDPNEVSARYEAFRAAREAAIIEKIRSVCGVHTGTRRTPL
jgi:hypothetical protein